MAARHFVPAAGLGVFVSVSLAAGQLLPFGPATVLVRAAARDAALAAAASGAALVALPSPGFAVLRGDAAHIRRQLGLTVRWQGQAGCATDR